MCADKLLIETTGLIDLQWIPPKAVYHTMQRVGSEDYLEVLTGYDPQSFLLNILNATGGAASLDFDSSKRYRISVFISEIEGESDGHQA